MEAGSSKPDISAWGKSGLSLIVGERQNSCQNMAVVATGTHPSILDAARIQRFAAHESMAKATIHAIHQL